MAVLAQIFRTAVASVWSATRVSSTASRLAGAGIPRQLPLFDHRGNRAPAQRLLDEVVAVEAFALDRKKKFAGFHGAGIDGISLGLVPTVVLAGRGYEFGDAGEWKFHSVFPIASAFAALLQS